MKKINNSAITAFAFLLQLIAIQLFAQYPVPNPYSISCSSAGTPIDDSQSGGSRSSTPINTCQLCARVQTPAISDAFYIPNTNTPIKEIQVNLIFVRRNDGTAGFDPVADNKFWSDVEGWTNGQLQSLSSSNTSQTNPDCYNGLIPDSRIRFKFNRHTVNNTAFWDNFNGGNNNVLSNFGCPQFANFYLHPLDIQLRSNPSFPNGINCYFTVSGQHYTETINNQPHATPLVNWACSINSTCDIDNSRLLVHFPGGYNSYIEPKAPILAQFPGTYYNPNETSYNQNNIYWWAVGETASGLLHEVGHCLFDEVHHRNYCTDHIMRQGSPRNYFPPQDLGEIHRMLTVGTVSKYTTQCTPLSNDYVVNSNMTVDYDWRSYQNIVVESGATLTVTCRIRMPDNSTITVKQNGRLVIDGGTITSACNGIWQGIKVWGNASQHQYVYGSNQLYQGFVELKNGAIIENAATAISLGKAGDWQMLNTGGIVQAYGNSIFRNNKRDIEFLKYQNFNPSNPTQKRGNLSYFRNCKFETTANLNDGSNPSNHVTMWNVDGVRFYGCTFENSNTNATSFSQLGNGIFTEDANFIVSGCDWTVPCLPGVCCGYAPNIFRNLNYGIWTKRVSGVSYNYNIDKSNFINCLFGVNNEGVDNAIITRNNLTVGKPRFASWWTTGINFNVGTGYRIEENAITRDPSPNSTSIGTWLTNTGMNYNQVYKNSFTNVTFGNYAYQRNRGYDASTGLYSGLAYLCNTHTTIGTNDIYISGTDPVNDGVRQYQGKLNSTNTNAINSAGNIFTRSGVNSESDIANPNTPNITYFYAPPAVSTNPEYPLYVTTNRVTRVSLTANTCPSTFGSGGSGKNSEIAELGINNGELSEEVKQQLLLDYQTNDQALNQYKGLYASLVDGGNTPQLKQTIESSWPTETWQLRQNLLGKSPYLSKEVLKESSDKTTVLPDAIIFEVLAANPDGLKDEELLKHLSEKVNPLPTWMIELLRDGSGQTTPRTFLEAAISNSKAQRDQVITYLVHDMISKRGDNQEINHLLLRSWLAAYQTPHGDYQIVDDYFETGNYNAGLAILSTVSTIYKLNEKEQLEYNGLQSLFNVLAGVNTSGRNIFLLDENEHSIIQDLADNGEGIAKVRACNLLGFVYGTECDYGLMLPDGTQFFKTDKAPVGKDNPILPSINIFPNPAKDYVEFSYNLPSGAMEGTLTITDLKGVVIHKQQIATKYGQIAIDTREWQQGTYIYALSANGNSVANQKFVLIK